MRPAGTSQEGTDPMKTSVHGQIVALAGLCLLSAPVARLARTAPARVPPRHILVPRSPSQAALLEARRLWTRAKIAAIEQNEALEAWDPSGTANLRLEDWKPSGTSADPTGCLRQ